MAIGAIFAGISAVASVVGGISGSQQASQQNQAAQQNYEEQKRVQREIADKTNEYNRRVFQADQTNYINQYNYQWETALQAWNRTNEIDDFQYLQGLRQYQRDLTIEAQQLDFNDLGAQQAYAAEDAALTGIFTQQMFEREDQVAALKKTLFEGEINRYATQAEFNAATAKGKLGELSIQQALQQYTEETSFKKEAALVDSMRAEGRAQLRQASRAKGRQSTMAEFYRGMSQLEASLSGRQRQAAMQLMEVGIDTSLAQTQLGVQRTRTETGMLNAVQDTQFNMRVLDADIASAVNQSLRNKKDIALRQYGADINAVAQTMIRPEKLAYSPAPIKPPVRVFVEPMEAIPGAVAAPVMQSTFAPIVAGIGSAAGSLANPALYKKSGD
jgi:hypothetical protein